MNKIKIIDSGCGKGKSSWAIQYMNENPQMKFIYITPFKTEIKDRILKDCTNFYQPKHLLTCKYDNFIELLKKGKNIASTHALFRSSRSEIIELIELYGYTLILDEVMDVVEQIPLKKDDLQNMLKIGLVEISENGYLKWIDKENCSQYDNIKELCLNDSVFIVNDCCLMWTFPIKIFNSFKDIYVLTYMFDCQIQKYYYDLFNVEYEYFSVYHNETNNKYYLGNKREDIPNKDLFDIYEGNLNEIGAKNTALSKSWFSKYRKTGVIILRNNLYNYFRHITESESKDRLWTTFKDFEENLSRKGFISSFLYSTARATNNKRETKVVVYALNKFLNPLLKQFFIDNKIEVDEEKYALSEMIQFIYRSAIRENKQIKLYIPSSRMRLLLQEFIEKSTVSRH